MLHQDTALVPSSDHLCTTTASLRRSSWPALPSARPPATAAHVLARRLCRLIARAGTPAALALLRDYDGPPSRLVLHPFLRAADAPPCYCSPTLLSPPHASTLTLNTALDALLTQVSGGMQHKHNLARSIPRPALLMLSPELVSHPVLRLVTALFALPAGCWCAVVQTQSRTCGRHCSHNVSGSSLPSSSSATRAPNTRLITGQAQSYDCWMCGFGLFGWLLCVSRGGCASGCFGAVAGALEEAWMVPGLFEPPWKVIQYE
ncbi:hypothetical protein C8J57DRAFT_1235195 [Mycena rebaudengoi]|nr:hypothetical protein C8J57DRAFT_1235195 [Mycena rebaudengoi]